MRRQVKRWRKRGVADRQPFPRTVVLPYLARMLAKSPRISVLSPCTRMMLAGAQASMKRAVCTMSACAVKEMRSTPIRRTILRECALTTSVGCASSSRARVPSALKPVSTTPLRESSHHLSNSCRAKPCCNMPGEAKTTQGPVSCG